MMYHAQNNAYGKPLGKKTIYNIIIIFLCFQDMMMFLNWTRVAILYEDEYGLIRLQELVRAPPTRNVEIYIRQVERFSS